jgi:hypothetical protein
MDTLTPQQFQELHTALLAAFDKADLQMLVRFNYPPAFLKNIDWEQPLDAVVTQVLNKLEERGDLDPLIRGMLQARPKKDKIVRFCQNYFPQAFQAPAQALLISDVTGGLTALIDALSKNRQIRLTLGRFQADIDTARDRIRTVVAYKVLHDSLHNLDQRLVPITLAVSRYREDPAYPLQLRRAIIDLRRESRRAREAAGSTPTRALELEWIEDLEQSIAELEDASKPPGDPAQMAPAVATFERLVVKADGINRQICASAAEMKLGALIKALTEINQQMPGNGPPEGPTAKLRAGLAGLKGLQSEFVRRVAEHQEWQMLDSALSTAESSPEHDPAKKVPRWPKVRDRLGRLCDLFPNEDWSAQLRNQRDVWERAAASGDWSASDLEAGTFFNMASNRFFDVDGELNALCERLKEVSSKMDDLIEVLTHATP